MPITKFGKNCDCDCCNLFETRFCQQLEYESESIGYLSDLFWDDEGSGGNAWQIQTTDGGCVDLVCPDTNKPFAYGIASVGSFSGRRALFKPNLPDEWHAYFDIELHYNSSLPDSNYNVGFEVAVDYVDDDNYYGARVGYDQNFEPPSWGFEVLAFYWQIFKVVAGVETILETHRSYSVAPSTSGRSRLTIEVALVKCEETGDRMIYLGDYQSGGSRQIYQGIQKVSNSGNNQFAMASQYSAYGSATTFDCDGVVSSIYDHVRLWGLTIERNEDNLEGCGQWVTRCGCECWIPEEFELTISGVANTDDCTDCTDLNDTFTLTLGESSLYACFDQNPYDCVWIYEADEHANLTCDVQKIQLTRCGLRWVVQFVYYDAFYDVTINTGRFDNTNTDGCFDISSLSMGPLSSGCWDVGDGIACPSDLCDVDGITITLDSV
jgi:hypothetical protein